jgi:hypothetical protein
MQREGKGHLVKPPQKLSWHDPVIEMRMKPVSRSTSRPAGHRANVLRHNPKCKPKCFNQERGEVELHRQRN